MTLLRNLENMVSGPSRINRRLRPASREGIDFSVPPQIPPPLTADQGRQIAEAALAASYSFTPRPIEPVDRYLIDQTGTRIPVEQSGDLIVMTPGQIPPIDIPLGPDPTPDQVTTIHGVVAELAERSGLGPDDIDLSSLSEPVITGFIIPAAPAEPIAQVPVEQDLLKNVVDRMDVVPDTRRVGANPWVHVSNLVRGMCTRQFWLARAHDTPVVSRWRGAHRVAFAMGHAAEAHVRGSIIDVMQPHEVFGDWKCRCGQTSRLMGTVPQTGLCAMCAYPADIYREPTLRNEAYRIIGRPDLTLHDEQRNKIVVEFKSISIAGWNGLSGPEPEHLAQALLYRWLYEQSGYAVHDEVILFYVSKDFNWRGSPYKEYHIDATSAGCALMVEAALTAARECFADEVPPNRTCPRPDHHIARACPLATICFNL